MRLNKLLQLFQQSIAKRTMVALSLAAILVLFMLIFYSYLEFELSTRPKLDADIQHIVLTLRKSLAETNDEAQARLVIKSLMALMNAQKEKNGVEDLVVYANIQNAQQKVLYTDPILSGLKIKVSNKIYDLNVQGKALRAFSVSHGNWTITMARTDIHFSSLLLLAFQEFAFYLVISLPFFMLPTWLGVRRGLQPLKALSQHIAQRDPADLSIIDLKINEAELKPIVHAINTLFAQLQLKLSQEKAFVHDAAHELQTPLARILALAHLISSETNAVRRTESLLLMQHSILNISHLIRQLLQLDRLSTDLLSERVQCDIAKLVRESLIQHTNQACFEFSFIAPDELIVNTVPHAILSMLNNLVVNAMLYTPQQSKIHIALAQSGDDLFIRVSDNGPGILENEWGFIFSRFYRAQGQRIEGSGLGLAIVKQACTQLGGTVSIRVGLEGRGCTFEVKMPINS